jgi:hypothetical protein
MRPLLAIIYPAALLLSGQATAAPEFAPNPRQAFDGFTAINPPRADVPVGALWINGYGPTGDGAGKDNLESDKSLSALTIDKNLQLSLSLGLLQLFGIDPNARDHYTARFTDLSLVRVKDVDKLPGVKGEPRIVEALKAGSVTISSDSEIGLNGQNSAWQRSDPQASGTADRAHIYSIEAHDMFIAIHVATPEVTHGKDQQLRLSSDGRSARIDDFLLIIDSSKCAPKPPCKPQIGIEKINSEMPASVARTDLDQNGTIRLPLPVPISDGAGGLYSTLAVQWVPRCADQKAAGCGKEPHIIARYEGTRLADLSHVDGKGW